jgi:tetratricopeptide (TPR) repeat protein
MVLSPRRLLPMLLALATPLLGSVFVRAATPQKPTSTRSLSTADEQMLHAALDEYDAGDARSAEPLLVSLTRRNPENYPAAEALGSLYAEAGKLKAALPLLQRATTLAPEESLAFANLGAAYLKLSRLPEAVLNLRHAVALDPGNAPSQSNLAQALMLSHDPQGALKAFAAASAAAPSDTKIRYDWALTLFDNGAPDRAVEVLSQIPAADMTDQQHTLAADANERAGHFKEALANFEEAAKQKPSDANLYGLTVELMRHWNWDEAIKVADYGSRLYPDSMHFRMAAGASLYARSDFSGAVKVFSALLSAEPENATVADLLGRSCAALADGEFTGCEAIYKYAQRHPGNPVMTTYAAIALLHAPGDTGNLDKAETLLHASIARNPNYAEPYLRLGTVQQVRQQWSASATSLERAVDLNPASAEAHFRLSRAYAHLGRREDAQKQNALRQSCDDQAKASLNARMQEVVRFVLTPN